MKRSRIPGILRKWSSNGYRSVSWSDLVTVLQSLHFEVKPKGGTTYFLSHEVLAKNAPEFSPRGAFLVDKPHRKGDPVDLGAMKKKVIPAIEMVLEFDSLEDKTDEAGY